MVEINTTPKTDSFTERDYKFENWALWGIEFNEADYTVSTRDLVTTFEQVESPQPKKEKVKAKPEQAKPASAVPPKAKTVVPAKPPVKKVEPPKAVEPKKVEPPAAKAPTPQPKKEALKPVTPPKAPEKKVEPAKPVPPPAKPVPKAPAKPTPQRKKLDFSKSTKETRDKFIPDIKSLVKSLSISSNQELNKLFPDTKPAKRDAEKELEDAEHKRLSRVQEESYKKDERTKHTYALKDFPLAEPELINQLAETHSKYFGLLVKLQDTHTPEDFVTAFRIQDRISYLLDNQTLLYKSLTKQLIQYLERINERLEKYLADITLKQEDIKRMNAQITRFNEYDRKTQTKIDQVEKETNLYQEDLRNYEESLKSQIELPKTPEAPEEPTNEAIVH
ncbi:hypothetical protein WEN_00975 [Mycoplasma wenyonii str. Massachusetts]|uniref:Uncharacterized protein n=1 Tax=Mycoplasma wenyonii (strain Massachusetts) TaxID=1197325 RepID=I6YAL6_MYCWM|nr:hypothetical protein [Mycoplasma wenyonii]AFN64996.1 hypothetical protein WEN_00975 [Mycoplasma wenyonii str. Massachusetts]